MEQWNTGNKLLSYLSDDDWGAIRPELEESELDQGIMLSEKDRQCSMVYFPVSCVISTAAIFKDGQTVEMATTGCEGLVPIGAILGTPVALNRQFVQIEGSAYSVSYAAFQRVLEQSRGFQRVMFCYAQAFIAQIEQSVACNATHTNEERAARWLLMSCDRAENDTFSLTQEFAAAFLGVTRPTISLIWRTFQNAGVISYRRGFITIADRRGLEELACECYQLVREEYDACFSRAQTANSFRS